MTPMRRKDRLVTDPARIEEIVKKCGCCRIGFNDDGEVYIVPMNFGYEKDGENYTFYFHGMPVGRKVDLIKKSPNVGFEMDAGFQLMGEGDVACKYSALFQSIVGTGVMSVVEDPEEKRKGLNLVMEYYTDRKDWEYEDWRIKGVAIFKLRVTELSCKEHQ